MGIGTRGAPVVGDDQQEQGNNQQYGKSQQAEQHIELQQMVFQVGERQQHPILQSHD